MSKTKSQTNAELKQKLDEALGELLRAADPISKTVISAYKHEFDYEENHKVISGAKFKVEVLERCAEYLGLNVLLPGGGKFYKNKSHIADHIILKIESYFENTCDECKQAYRHHVADEDKPKICCFLCLQGAHDCDQMNAKLDPLLAMVDSFPQGFVWVCRGCRLKNETRTCASLVAQAAPDAIRNDNIADGLEEDVVDDLQGSPNLRRERHPTGPTGPTPASQLDICPLYKKAQCPHGLTGKKLIDGATCTQAHPKRCIRYCRFGLSKRGGCTRGAECRYYHPVLCRNALVNKRCTRENCTFTHLKGTRRHQEDEKRRTQAGRDAGQEAPAAGRDSNTRVSTAQQGQPSQDPNTGQRVRFNIGGDAQQHQRQSTGAAPAQPATNLSCDASFLEDLISRIMDRKFNQMQRPTMMQPAMQTRLNPQAQAFTSAFPPLSMS